MIGTDQQFAVCLSQEELSVLVALMGVATLPGMKADTSETTRAGDASALNRAIQRALIARGFVEQKDDASLLIDPGLRNIIGFCLYAERMVILVARQFEAANNLVETYYQTPEVIVQHTVPIPGIHRLAVVVEPDDPRLLVLDRLPMVSEDSASTVHELTAQAFTEIQVLARAGKTAMAHTLLIENGWPGMEAEILTIAMQRPTLRLWLQESISAKAEARDLNLTLLFGNGRCWSIEGLQIVQGNAPIRITSLSSDEVRRAVERFFGHTRIDQIA